MIRVAIVGGAGRMGQIMTEAFAGHEEIRVVALVDPSDPVARSEATWVRTIDALDASEIDAVLDFSNATVASTTLQWCLDHDVAVVVGASGLTTDEIATWSAKYVKHQGHAVVASNFSIGAVLAERFAEQAAPYFTSVEIVEMHHDRKLDSPSGTAIATAERIAAARERASKAPLIDVTERETIPHGRGAAAAGGIRVHSVRLPGLVAHQEIIFGQAGEGLTIRHDSYDRVSFVAGVALALRAVRSRVGLTFGINELV